MKNEAIITLSYSPRKRAGIYCLLISILSVIFYYLYGDKRLIFLLLFWPAIPGIYLILTSPPTIFLTNSYIHIKSFLKHKSILLKISDIDKVLVTMRYNKKTSTSECPIVPYRMIIYHNRATMLELKISLNYLTYDLVYDFLLRLGEMLKSHNKSIKYYRNYSDKDLNYVYRSGIQYIPDINGLFLILLSVLLIPISIPLITPILINNFSFNIVSVLIGILLNAGLILGFEGIFSIKYYSRKWKIIGNLIAMYYIEKEENLQLITKDLKQTLNDTIYLPNNPRFIDLIKK